MGDRSDWGPAGTKRLPVGAEAERIRGGRNTGMKCTEDRVGPVPVRRKQDQSSRSTGCTYRPHGKSRPPERQQHYPGVNKDQLGGEPKIVKQQSGAAVRA